MDINVIYNGDVLDKLKEIPDKCVNTCITSPPYFGLRDYGTGEWIGGDSNCKHRRESKKSDNTITGHKNFDDMLGVGDAIYKTICPLCGAIRIDKQIGLEESPDQYVAKLVEVFREVRRVLRDDGTLWLNLGDSYAGSGKGQWKDGEHDPKKNKTDGMIISHNNVPNGLKPKDLIGIPWRVAFALQADGWYLRQDIIWHKPNPMPESVTDRCTKSHEYIFLLSKSKSYYYDNEIIKEKANPDLSIRNRDSTKLNNTPGRTRMGGLKTNDYEFRNKRDVWSVTTKPFKEAHFATFPEKLIEPCVLAGCPENGIVLDPFMGSGTTAYVSRKNYRNYIGIELNKEYIDIANKRLKALDNLFFMI